MARLVLFLVALCVLTYSYVAANENCKEEFQNMKKKMNEIMESGNAPQCVEDYKLKDFECTGGEDPDKDKETQEKFKEYFKGMSDEDKEGIKSCIKEMAEKALEEVELSDECKEEAKKIESKMTGE
ncbi:unnamed protein product [Larinioides sclopetarius]|uniref:Uncharacterized protein n=1 Tax=Larinioides sclopetarius TaxID=280406 RepID=A0AAV1YSJ6_9ARAC